MMQQFMLALLVSSVNGYAIFTCMHRRKHFAVKTIAFIIAVVSTFAFTHYMTSN
jgi:hypothetical protein